MGGPGRRLGSAGPGQAPTAAPGRLLLACRAAHRPVLAPGMRVADEAPTREPQGFPLPGATAVRPRRHPASARDCDSAVAQVRPPPPAAPPPPLPHGGGQPGSTRGSGVGPAGDPGLGSLGPTVPEKTRGARWGRGAAELGMGAPGHRVPSVPDPWEVSILPGAAAPRWGLRLSGWGPAPPPTAAVGASGLRSDTVGGDPGRERAGCVRRGSAAVPLLRARMASGPRGG